MKHHDIQLTGSISITGSLTVPVGTTDERPLNPKSGSLRMNTTTGVLEVYTAETGSEWVTVGEQTGAAAALGTDIEYLLVAGGGSGGSDYGGGGGAGGYLSSSLSSVESGSSFTVTVGGGASAVVGGNNDGADGTDSSISGTGISTITTTGGGGGGSEGVSVMNGHDGGSGGGGGFSGGSAGSGGSGTVGQGNDGGDGQGSGGQYLEGGGGGAGTAGEDAVASTSNGDGGNGLVSKITGTSVTRAGGGGAGYSSDYSKAGASGGSGGGGAGGTSAAGAGTAGTANTGGGGGGAGGSSTGVSSGAGGSGVAIFAYPTGSINGAGGIQGTTSAGKKYHQFNESGTFTIGSTSDFEIPNQANLSILWRPDDFSSRGTSTITDLSGNSRNGTVSNATLGNNPYYTFNASNAKITNSLTRPNTAQTLIIWMRFDGDGATGYSLSGWQEGGSYNYIGRLNTGNLYYYIGDSTGGDSGYALSLSTWYMLTQTVDASGNHNIYVDTTSRVTNSTINMGSAGSLPLTIGAIGGTSNYWHNGLISTVAFYNTNFTQSDVESFYNATKTNFV